MNQDVYVYTVHVLKQGDPRVLEEDIEIAAVRLGYDVQVYEESDTDFTAYSHSAIKTGVWQKDIQTLDGRSQCRVSVRCVSKP